MRRVAENDYEMGETQDNILRIILIINALYIYTKDYF